MRKFNRVPWTNKLQLKHKLKHTNQEAGHSMECITHAGHSITFNTFLYFVILWSWPLTFDLILLVGEDSWWTIPETSLVIVVSAVLVLSRGQTHTHRQTDRQTDTHRQTRMIAILSRLPSAWVTTSSAKKPDPSNHDELWDEQIKINSSLVNTHSITVQ